MSAPSEKGARRSRKRTPDGDSYVYDGRTLLGEIRCRKGVHSAWIGGEKRGEFRSSQEAMRAICAAARRANFEP